jgi:hypothetical protein
MSSCHPYIVANKAMVVVTLVLCGGRNGGGFTSVLGGYQKLAGFQVCSLFNLKSSTLKTS